MKIDAMAEEREKRSRSIPILSLHLDSRNNYMDNRNDKNHGEEQKDNQTDKKSLKMSVKISNLKSLSSVNTMILI